jgi:putative iron-regulated protein
MALFIALLAACSPGFCSRAEQGAVTSSDAADAAVAFDEQFARGALLSYLQIGEASYQDSVAGVEQLSQAVDALLAAPSPESLSAAQQAWLGARSAYAQSEVFRFYDGPIDQVELLVNTWPIDEGYVESEPDAAVLGLVQDVQHYPELSAELLAKLNGQGGETAISTGYHVIEFLLWGRDENAAGPGQRSYRDFVVEARGSAREQNSERERPSRKQAPSRAAPEPAGEALLALRRGQYLKSAVALLLRNLREVHAAFMPAPGNYRAQFASAAPAAGLYWALKGMAKLSGPELSGERLTVPYETKSQENEHSCFSDSTQRDLWANALGVENVCLGRYRRDDGSEIRGVGICAVVQRAQPALGQALTAQVSESVRATRAIPAPFDQAILGADSAPGRVAIKRAITGLHQQAELLEQARAALALADPTPIAVLP